MSTPVLRWPNVMASLRDGAADELVRAEMQLEALAFSPRRMTENEKLLNVTTALASVQKALRFLENAGAQTRPQQRKES